MTSPFFICQANFQKHIIPNEKLDYIIISLEHTLSFNLKKLVSESIVKNKIDHLIAKKLRAIDKNYKIKS